MNRLYRFQSDIVNMILLFLSGYTLMEFILLRYTGKPSDLYIFIGLVPASILSLLICKVRRLLLVFWAVQAVLLAGYLFVMQDTVARLITGCFILINTVLASEAIRKDSSIRLSGFSFIIQVFMNVYCYYRYPKEILLNSLNLAISLICLVLVILILYLARFENYFTEYEKIYVMPISQIKLSNHFIIIALIGVYSVVIILFALSPVGKLISNIIRTIYTWFIKKNESNASSLVPLEPDILDKSRLDFDQMQGVQDIAAGGQLSSMAKIILILILVIGTIAIMGLIANILIKFFKRYFRKQTMNMMDQYEFLSPFEASGEEKKRNKKGRVHNLNSLFFKTNSERIRKYYYKAVLDRADQNRPLEYLTPSELSEYVLGSNQGLSRTPADSSTIIADRLTNLYEKARYSEGECSESELTDVKVIIKNGSKYAGRGNKRSKIRIEDKD